jgi:hypothetical protein
MSRHGADDQGFNDHGKEISGRRGKSTHHRAVVGRSCGFQIPPPAIILSRKKKFVSDGRRIAFFSPHSDMAAAPLPQTIDAKLGEAKRLKDEGNELVRLGDYRKALNRYAKVPPAAPHACDGVSVIYIIST